jgi:hypothetical protein
LNDDAPVHDRSGRAGLLSVYGMDEDRAGERYKSARCQKPGDFHRILLGKDARNPRSTGHSVLEAGRSVRNRGNPWVEGCDVSHMLSALYVRKQRNQVNGSDHNTGRRAFHW